MFALFDVSHSAFDVFALIAAIIFVISAYLLGRTNQSGAAWTLTGASLQAIGLAVFSVAFLFLTP